MQWRPVPEYEGIYEVSENGQIRRCVDKRNHRAGKILAQHLTHDGYCRLTLHKDCESRMFTIHVLVAAAFIGPRPSGLQVNHKDANKLHNNYLNLEYATGQENQQHASVHGLAAHGERGGNSKLTWKRVDRLRFMWMNGVPPKRLSAIFGVSAVQVGNIVSGKQWWYRDPAPIASLSPSG